VSIFVIWDKRTKVKDMRVVPWPAGLWMLGVGLLLDLFGRWWFVNVIANFSMPVVCAGLGQLHLREDE